MDSSYVALHPYERRLAEPPRVTVPPPSMQIGADNKPSVFIAGVDSHDYDGEFGDPQFLQQIASKGCNLNHRMLEWRYEERRQAQAILPFLYLGPSSAAQDREFLIKQGITLLVAVRHNDSLYARLVTSLKRADELNLSTAVIVASTAGEMIRQMPGAIRAINKHLQQTTQLGIGMNGNHDGGASLSGKALVFCENGSDRSPIIVLGYLMTLYNLTAIEAIQAVQSQRFCISIDEPMKHMLLDFEGLLKAKRDVKLNDRIYKLSLGDTTPNGEPSRSHKRPLVDVDDDGDESMEMGMENLAVENQRYIRGGSAPFRDMDE